MPKQDTGPGLAYTARYDGRVRATFDGKYVTLQMRPEDITNDVIAGRDGTEVLRRLRQEFAAGRGEPIPVGGLPALD